MYMYILYQGESYRARGVQAVVYVHTIPCTLYTAPNVLLTSLVKWQQKGNNFSKAEIEGLLVLNKGKETRDGVAGRPAAIRIFNC